MFDISDAMPQSEHLVITRYVPATLKDVYAAWTDAQILSRWFAPNIRWQRVEAATDLRVGGTYSLSMHHVDGDIYTIAGKYQEIIPERRLRFTFKWIPGLTPSEPGNVTVDFAGIGRETEVRIKHVNIACAERSEIRRGWEGCLDVLETLFSDGTTHLEVEREEL
jgi:uncharacterized protein YndB with AHSA1/START domain